MQASEMFEIIIELPVEMDGSAIVLSTRERGSRCSGLNKGESGLKWLVPGGYILEPMVFLLR